MDRQGLTLGRKQGERWEGNRVTWMYGKSDNFEAVPCKKRGWRGGQGVSAGLGWMDTDRCGSPSMAGSLQGSSGSVGGLEG